MELPIPEKIKNLWDLWNIRFCILLSLSLQVFLVLFASSRQRSRNTLLQILLWSTYLTADWIAAVSIGLISNSQSDSSKGNKNILAFWVSFLLLHLGGPDSITSYSLEDNELWLRQLFGLVLQVIGAGYTLFRTIPDNNLWLPTILVLLVGAIKYAERTAALYLASLDCFGSTALPEPYAGHDYEQAVAKYSKTRSVQVPEQTEITMAANVGSNYKDRSLNSESDEMELLLTAYSLFEDFKGLIVDFLISSSDRESSRKLFLQIKSEETSFRLIEYELGLIYQLLHTKVAVVCSIAGIVLRFLSLCSMAVAVILFNYLVDNDKSKRFELILTYVLLIGAIVLDVVSGIKLIFSDWVLISLSLGSWKKYIPKSELGLQIRSMFMSLGSWKKYIPTSEHSFQIRSMFMSLLKKLGFKSQPRTRSGSVSLSLKMMSIRKVNIFATPRWSGSVSQYNMIGYCLDASFIWKGQFPDSVRTMLDKIKMLWFSTSEKDIQDLKYLIFEELKLKSSKAKNPSDAKMVCSERGESALLRSSSYIKLKWSINEFQYAESLLLWHLATELCYQKIKCSRIDHDQQKKNEESTKRDIDSKRVCKLISEDKELATDNDGIDHDQQKKNEESTKRDIDSKRVCKLISDYMFYLLVMKPTMLAPVLGNWQIVFQDTFEEAKRFFTKHKKSDHVEACKQLINVKTKFRPAAVKGMRSKSVLFDACILAQQLQHLDEDQWMLMSKVWVELLGYGAINCKPMEHAQQTSRGGEFFTFTWLLMNHLGLGSQFNEQEEQAGTKIVAVK